MELTTAQGGELGIVERRRVDAAFALRRAGRLLPEETLRTEVRAETEHDMDWQETSATAL